MNAKSVGVAGAGGVTVVAETAELIEAAAPTPSKHPLLGWDIAFAIIIFMMSVAVLWDARTGSGIELGFGLGLGLGVLLAFAAAYVLIGRAALRRAVRGEPATLVDLVYLAIALALIGIATAVTPDFATLQAIGYPMIWTIVARYRTAVLWNVVLAVLVGVGCAMSFSRLGVPGGVWLGAGVGAISLAFAIFMGTWMTRIFAQGERYRLLAEHLRAAQNEVATLSTAAGAAAEREQLSRELHDTLTQTLAGLVMLSEQAGKALDAGDIARARERLSRVEEAARSAGGEARALVASTHPLDERGLEPAVERVAETLRQDFGLEVTCELERVDLARDLQVVLLRAVQEGLANVRRHAQAKRVWVRLAVEATASTASAVPPKADATTRQTVLLSIEDDGVGPIHAPGAQPGQGFGLRGLRDRVGLVGGEIAFAAREAGGSRLTVRLPVAHGRETEDVQ